MGIEDDILTDTNLDRRRTLSGNVALGLTIVMFLFIIVGFSTPYWVEADDKFYGTKFVRLGLWVHCFRSLADYNDFNHQRFYAGCRWIFNPFTEGYDDIRSYIVPPFMVATQFFFTLCFVGMLGAVLLALAYLLCLDDYYKVKVLTWIGVILNISAVLGTIALIIFGILGDNKDFMPDAEQNYLSWSFGVSFVGVFMMYVCSILYLVEARIIIRKDIARDMQYPMEKQV